MVAGRTGCGKTIFLKKLGLNNFFGDIIKIEWISRIDNDKQRKAEIQSYFSNETKVHVGKEQDELDSLIETFKLRSCEESNGNHNVTNSFGENKWINLLLWMMFLAVLKYQKKLVIFELFLENLAIIMFMYFMLLIPQVKFGKKLFLKTTFSIFFHQVFHITLLQKSFKVIAFYKVKSMFLHASFG